VALSEPNLALAVVARPPVPGRVKTRLAAPLGGRRACETYVTLLRETMRSLEQFDTGRRLLALAPDRDSRASLAPGPTGEPPPCAWDTLLDAGFFEDHRDAWTLLSQRGTHLGERLGNLFEDLFAQDFDQVVIVNSDSPGLPVEYLGMTRRWLSQCEREADARRVKGERQSADRRSDDRRDPVVFGPTPDGGFYLVAVARPTWLRHGRALTTALAAGALGGSDALESVVTALQATRVPTRLLPYWVDVDDEADLALAGRLLPQTGWAPQGRPRGEPLSELREVFLHVTNRCGTGCPHCYARLKDDNATELTTAQWRDAIDQAAALGARSFVFLGGDPFVRHDLLDLVDLVTGPLERKARVFFNRGLSEGMASRLAAAGRDRLTPLLSLDGPPAINDGLRGSGNFAAAMRSLEHLLTAGLRPVVNTVALRPVLPGLPELARIVGERGVRRLHLILPHQRGGLEEHLEMAPSGEELLAAFDELLPAAAEAGVVIDNLVAWQRRLRAPQDFCNAGCKDIAVDPSGLVYACAITCGDPAFVAGDLRERRLEDIWRESPAFALLRAARARDRAACAACDVVDACGGECWMQAHYAARAPGRAGGFGAEFPYCGLVRPVLRKLARQAEEAGDLTVLGRRRAGDEVSADRVRRGADAWGTAADAPPDAERALVCTGQSGTGQSGTGQSGAGEADLTLFDCI
jgi:radical SAM protein with 4Fe4S-binding SPASM domain